MFKGDFMQLLLILLLLMSGSPDLKNITPLIEGAVGEEASGILGEVEQLSRIASAFAPQGGGGQSGGQAAEPLMSSASAGACPPPQGQPSGGADCGFPLAPISRLADEKITYCLARYISSGQ